MSPPKISYRPTFGIAVCGIRTLPSLLSAVPNAVCTWWNRRCVNILQWTVLIRSINQCISRNPHSPNRVLRWRRAMTSVTTVRQCTCHACKRQTMFSANFSANRCYELTNYPISCTVFTSTTHLLRQDLVQRNNLTRSSRSSSHVAPRSHNDIKGVVMG